MANKKSRAEGQPKQHLTPNRLKFLAERNATALTNPAATKLRSKLLTHAGEEVLLRVTPEEIDRLLAHGEFHPGKGAGLRRMQANGCHFNAAKLFLTGRAAKVVSGFALSDDGLWRSHTWVLNSHGRIIETTEPREVYFGTVLGSREILLECVDEELMKSYESEVAKLAAEAGLTRRVDTPSSKNPVS
jgi:hypothetical protein